MIEKNIPMPKTHRGPGNAKYTEFREMEVGDSVFFEGQTVSGRAATAARVYGSRSMKRFSSRTEEGGVRIWRIK